MDARPVWDKEGQMGGWGPRAAEQAQEAELLDPWVLAAQTEREKRSMD